MTPQVLMLEDDSDDRYLTREVLSELGIDVDIHFFYSSNDMFDHLVNADKPSLILVDYNTTPDNAPEVLRKLKKNTNYSDIPVVVLSDSDLQHYKKECYVNGASSFIKKPDTMEGTRRKISTFFKYWFEVAEV